MAITDQDLAAYAARIRPHFPAAQQDTAEAVAYCLASVVGPKIKELKPDTSMSTVLAWLKETPSGLCSPDWVELLMAIELEVSSEVTDDFAETLESRRFSEYVAHLVSQKRPNKSLERTRGR
jgi:hypothetical protein